MDFHDPNLVFYADLAKHDGAAFMSDDAYGYLCTVTTATWQLNGRNFVAATPDYIELAAESVMNFTSGDFSVIARIYISTLSNHSIISRGLTSTDGWWFYVLNDGTLRVRTNQAAANQVSRTAFGSVTDGAWFTVGFSRSGSSILLYLNGTDSTDSAASHTNPLTSARTVKIGIYDDLGASPMNGIIQDVFAYNRSLSALEHLNKHNLLRIKGKCQ